MTTTGSRPAARASGPLTYIATPIGRVDVRAIHRDIERLMDKQIFFVGGVMKSGTTWLQRLLDLHPQVSCGGESHFMSSLYPVLKVALEEHNGYTLDRKSNTAYELGIAPPIFESDELLYALASAMLLLLRKQVGARNVRAVGEKTNANVQLFDALARLFPGAKCVHIVRDPRDAIISGWHHMSRLYPDRPPIHFRNLGEYAEAFAEQWAMEAAKGVEFGTRVPRQYIELRYEELVGDPVPTLARVFRFLGVDDRDDVVRGCNEGASFERLSGGRPRGQEDPRSFFRKGVVGDWKGRLSPDTLVHIAQKAGPLMQRFGYI